MSWNEEISPLPKYVEQITRCLLFFDFALDNAGTEMLNISIYFLPREPDSLLFQDSPSAKSGSTREYFGHFKAKAVLRAI